MAGTGSVTITGSKLNLQTGTQTFGPATISSAPATELNLAYVLTLVLASGANTITIPSTTCVGVIISFNAASTVTKTLKGVTGDTGVVLAVAGTNVLNFGTGTASTFVITTNGADTGNVTEFWFF